MVVWSIAAAWLAWIAVASALACPWILHTRKGVLLLHWIGANLIESTWTLPHLDSLLSSRCLILPLATVFLYLEMSLMAGKPDRLMDKPECFVLFSFLLAIDLLCLVYGSLAHLEIAAGLIVFLSFLGTYLICKSVRSPHTMTQKERIDLYSSDLFYDWRRPLECLGFLGKLHFLSILASLFLQVSVVIYRETQVPAYLQQYVSHLPPAMQVSFLPCAHLVVWCLFISRSLCTLSISCQPTFYGAFTHTAKTFGRYVAERKKRKQGEDSLLANVAA